MTASVKNTYYLNPVVNLPHGDKNLCFLAASGRIAQKKFYEAFIVLGNVLSALAAIRGPAVCKDNFLDHAIIQMDFAKNSCCILGFFGSSWKTLKEAHKGRLSLKLISNLGLTVGFGAMSATSFLYNEVLKKRFAEILPKTAFIAMGTSTVIELVMTIQDLNKAKLADTSRVDSQKDLDPNAVLQKKQEQLNLRIKKIAISLLSAAITIAAARYQIKIPVYLQVAQKMLGLCGTAMGLKADLIRETSRHWVIL